MIDDVKEVILSLMLAIVYAAGDSGQGCMQIEWKQKVFEKHAGRPCKYVEESRLALLVCFAMGTEL